MSAPAWMGTPGGILLFGWVLGCILLAISYRLAGYIWVERHSLHFHIGTRPARCSGAIGEAIILLLCAGLLFLVDANTPAFSIADLLTQHWELSLLTTAIMAGVILFYSISTAREAPAEGQPADFRKRLVRAYLVYSGYSTLLFTGGLLLLFTMTSQFVIDGKSFNDAAGRVLSATVPASDNADVLMTIVEKTFIEVMSILNTVKDQMSPVFIFAIGIFTVNLLILYTPLRSLFLNNAVFLTNLSTLTALTAIMIVGAAVYIASYSLFINNYLDALRDFRDPLANSDWKTLSRYAQILFVMDEKKNLVGFVTEMTNEWGGLAAILGAVQWAVGQFRKPSAEASSADLEEAARPTR